MDVATVSSPAEVLFSREADTAYRMEYVHILLPLNVTFLLAVLDTLEEKHRIWHNKTQSDYMPDSDRFRNYTPWFLDNPKRHDPTTQQSTVQIMRLHGLRRKATFISDLFSTVDTQMDTYTRNFPSEAHDFLRNNRPYTFPAASKTYYDGKRPRKRTRRHPIHALHLPPVGQAPHLLSRVPRNPAYIVAGIVAIIGIIAVTFSSLYTAREIKKLHDSLITDDWSHTYREEHLGQSQSAIMHLLNKAIQLYDHNWADYRDGIATTVVLDAVERRLGMFDHALACGLDRRVSPAHFLDVDLPRTAARIERHALALGMVPLAHHVSDWLQFEASLVATDYGLDVIMHVPMYDPSSLLHIYRFHPLPIPLDHGLHLQLDPAPFTHLAIDASSSYFRALSLAQISACRQIGLFRLCDLGSVVRIAPDQSTSAAIAHIDPELCLWALFSRDFKTAGTVCDSNIGVATSAMAQVGPRTFASYSTTAHRGMVTCHNSSNPHLAFTVNGLKKVTIPFGCWAETDTHRFTAADHSLSRTADTFSLSYDWETPISLLTRNLNITAFAELRNESRTLVGQVDALVSLNHAAALVERKRLASTTEDPTPLDQLRAIPGNAVDSVKTWTLDAIHSTFGPSAALVLAAILIFPAYVLLFRQRAELIALRALVTSRGSSAQMQPLIIQTAPAPRIADRMTYRELFMDDDKH